MKHVMIPYRPHKVFLKAFENALSIAKQNNANLSLIKVINYPIGIGIDTLMAADMVSREYELHKFDKILEILKDSAIKSNIQSDVHVLDMRLSPAKAIIDFASKNKVDLMVIGCVKNKGPSSVTSSDISEEIMSLHPPCSVRLVEDTNQN